MVSTGVEVFPPVRASVVGLLHLDMGWDSFSLDRGQMESDSTECVVQQSHFGIVGLVVSLGLHSVLEVVISFKGGLGNLSSVNDLAVVGKLECM